MGVEARNLIISKLAQYDINLKFHPNLWKFFRLGSRFTVKFLRTEPEIPTTRFILTATGRVQMLQKCKKMKLRLFYSAF